MAFINILLTLVKRVGLVRANVGMSVSLCQEQNDHEPPLKGACLNDQALFNVFLTLNVQRPSAQIFLLLKI